MGQGALAAPPRRSKAATTRATPPAASATTHALLAPPRPPAAARRSTTSTTTSRSKDDADHARQRGVEPTARQVASKAGEARAPRPDARHNTRGAQTLPAPR